MIKLTFKVVDSIAGANGDTGTLPNSTNTIHPVTGEVNLNLVIRLDGAYISNSSAIAVVKTILHESIHAYLILKHIKCNLGTPFDDIIEDINDKKLDELLNFYYETACPDEEQHEFMFANMIPTMSGVLADIRDDLIPTNHRTFAEEVMFINEEMPSTYPDGSYVQDVSWSWETFYKYLSMSGLQNTDAFKLEIGEANPVEEQTPKYKNYRSYAIEYGIGRFKKECDE